LDRNWAERRPPRRSISSMTGRGSMDMQVRLAGGMLEGLSRWKGQRPSLGGVTGALMSRGSGLPRPA
jgi:hypothetical protein